jgi:hypothetical protein
MRAASRPYLSNSCWRVLCVVSAKTRNWFLQNTSETWANLILRKKWLNFGSCKTVLSCDKEALTNHTVPIRIVKRKSQLFESLFLFCLKPCPLLVVVTDSTASLGYRTPLMADCCACVQQCHNYTQHRSKRQLQSPSFNFKVRKR